MKARSNGLLKQYFYNELKGGLSYDLDKNFTLLLGGGHYSTFTEPGPVVLEKRLWQQLVLSQYMSRLKIEHCYRVEQRWLLQGQRQHGVPPAPALLPERLLARSLGRV